MFSKLKSPDGFYGWVNLVVMFLFNIALYPMMFTFVLCPLIMGISVLTATMLSIWGLKQINISENIKE